MHYIIILLHKFFYCRIYFIHLFLRPVDNYNNLIRDAKHMLESLLERDASINTKKRVSS